MFIEKVKGFADLSAWTIIGATLIKWLPPVAAALAIIWHLTQFYMLWKNTRGRK